MAAAAPKLGSRGGGSSGFSRRAFEEGELSWTRDVFITYWVKGKHEPLQRQARRLHARPTAARRYGLGQFTDGRASRRSRPSTSGLSAVARRPRPATPAPPAGPPTARAQAARQDRGLRRRRPGARRPARYAVIAVVYLLFMNVVVGLSAANILNGIALGSLYGIIGVALVLVYRTSRIINFAASALGAVPAIFALLLTTTQGRQLRADLPDRRSSAAWRVGALTDIVVMRRFAKAPRLIVTVVTIGLAQSFAVIGFFLPVWFGERADAPPVVDDALGAGSPSRARAASRSCRATRSSPSSSSACRPPAWRCSSPAAAWAWRCGPRPRTPSAPRCWASRSSRSAPSPGRSPACSRAWRSSPRRR